MKRAHVSMLLSGVLAAMIAPVAASDSTAARLYSSVTLSGTSAYALLQAYRALPIASRTLDAPQVLSRYSVQVLPRPNETLVTFFPNEVSRITNVTVKDGLVVSRDNLWPTQDAQPILLPGVIAGELIAAYGAALDESSIAIAMGAATFDVGVEVAAGGSIVAFVPHMPPEYMKNRNCLAGNCDGRAAYRVRIQSGSVVVEREAIL